MATVSRLLLLIGGACLIWGADADVPKYRVQFLGPGTTGTGINELGVVCGNISLGDGTSLLAAVSKNGGPLVALPLPPGMQTSRAYDINDAGVIVGAVCPNQYVISQPTAAVWHPTANGYEVEVLGGLPGDPYSAAYAINNVGDIVGGSGFWGWNLSTGVIFTQQGAVRLGDGSPVSDVNDNRQVLLTGPRILDLNTGDIVSFPLPPGNWQGMVASAINNRADFCGYILGYSGCSRFPIRYRQGIGWEFTGGCATTTGATAINDWGDVLQYYYMSTSSVHFVEYGLFGLGALIDPSQGEWYVQYGGANGINNRRQIVAAAQQGANGPIGAILMSPLVPNGPQRIRTGTSTAAD
ncbi:MAG: hypothetical protein AMXMBFR61_21800 [Fimbriimonadales bacterium]